MRSFFRAFTKYFCFIIFIFLAIAMVEPYSFHWVLGKVPGTDMNLLSWLLGVCMFAVGTTLNLQDFLLILKHPSDAAKGALAQFIIMPTLAYLISRAFHLDPALTAGMILVGTSPGGLSSNIFTFLSKGDVALSVTMTSVSTTLSPIMTPFITYLLIGEEISFSPIGMFWSIIQMVIVPILLGLFIKHYFPRQAERATDFTIGFSCMLTCCIICGIVGNSRDAIWSASGTIFAVVILHNLLGYALGFIVARLDGMSWEKTIAFSLEIGMQNAALSAGLAHVHFAAMPLAAVPGALFAPWTNISGAIFADVFNKFLNPKYHPAFKNKSPK